MTETNTDKLQRAVLLLGSAVASVLLLRFAFDFSRSMSILLAAPFFILAITALVASFSNALRYSDKNEPSANRAFVSSAFLALLYVSVIPIAFLASSLDCTGLTAWGCTPFCTFVKMIWLPLLAVGSLAYWLTRRPRILLAMTVASFVPLAPHCICYNEGNAFWIDRLGASPVCYIWGFTASMIAIGALHSGRRRVFPLIVCFAIIGGSLTFFVTHHYFGYPW